MMRLDTLRHPARPLGILVAAVVVPSLKSEQPPKGATAALAIPSPATAPSAPLASVGRLRAVAATEFLISDVFRTQQAWNAPTRRYVQRSSARTDGSDSLALIRTVSFPAPGESNVQQRERVLADLPGTILGDLQTSPGNRHVFAAMRLRQTAPDSGAWAVYRDGALVGRYDGELPKRRFVEFLIPGLEIAFSSDGGHYGFIGTRGGQAFAVVDGVEGPHYDAVTGLQIGRDGLTVAYTVGRSPSQWLVTNGRVGLRYFSVGARAVSPDGRHLAHQVSTGTVSRLFLDGNDVFHAFLLRGNHLVRVDGRF